MKYCKRCDTHKNLDSFNRHKSAKDGLQFYCKECISAAKKASYQKHRESRIKRNFEYNKRNPEVIRACFRRYHETHKEKERIYARYYQATYKLRKKQSCPDWLTPEQLLEIKEIYARCPKGFHVDHIIPLNGKTVRGLHVPWNLQYLTAEENMTKGNKLI